jgi:hypothetical protein
MQPNLLSSCARAATAAEARFRIDRPIAGRSARVVALDEGAAAVARRISEQSWSDAHFFTSEDRTPAGNGGDAEATDIVMRALDGSESRLSEELVDAEVVIMLATSGGGAEAASAIARACARRGVMMAGLILGDRLEFDAALSALRPYAPVLMVTWDEDDLSELLRALRA